MTTTQHYREATRTVALLVIGCGLLVGFWLFLRVGSDAESLERITVDNKSLSLGIVPPQKNYAFRVTISNSSDDTIVVTGVRTSCRCTRQADRKQTRLLPGTRASLGFVADFTPKNEAEKKKLLRHFKIKILLEYRVAGSDRVHMQQLGDIEAQVQQPFYIVPDRIDLGMFPDRGFDGPGSIARIYENEPLEKIDVIADDQSWLSSVEKNSGGYWALRLDRQVPFGRDGKQEILVRAKTKAGTWTPPLALPISWRAAQPFHIEPRELHFGAMAVGTSETKSFVLHSTWVEPFEVVRASFTGISDGALRSIQKNAETGPSVGFSVSIRSSRLGHQRGVLSLLIRKRVSRDDIVKVDLPLRYYGAEVASAPTSADCREVSGASPID